jgi:hypothetical protein
MMASAYSSSTSLSSAKKGSDAASTLRRKPVRRAPLKQTPLRWSFREGLVLVGRLPNHGRLDAFSDRKIKSLRNRELLATLKAQREAEELARMEEEDKKKAEQERIERETLALKASRVKQWTRQNKAARSPSRRSQNVGYGVASPSSSPPARPADASVGYGGQRSKPSLLRDAAGQPHGYGHPKPTENPNYTPLGYRVHQGYNTPASEGTAAPASPVMKSASPLPPTSQPGLAQPEKPARKRVQTGILRWRRATECDFSISTGVREATAGPIIVDADVVHKVRARYFPPVGGTQL